MDYGKVSYWDARYAAEPEPFEWYHSYAAFEPFIKPHLKPNSVCKALVVGCGNSSMCFVCVFFVRPFWVVFVV
jgi:hypothetical protein